jgi:oligoendopeptidase F
MPATLPKRSQVKTQDQWNLASLYPSDKNWEADFKKWEGQIDGYAKWKGRLGESAQMIADCFSFDRDLDRLGEKLGNYASLKTTEDQGNSTYQRMMGRFRHVATKAGEAASWIRPELMAVPQGVMDGFLKDPVLGEWALALERILRYRPFTLGPKEEQLLAMSAQMSDASNQAFRQLNDADLRWPVVKDEKGKKVELGHSSFSKFLHSPKAGVRKDAFHVYYSEFEKHKNTLAATYNASVQRDVFYAKCRGYSSARESSLFHDNVPVSVYDKLIESVHKNLPAVHGYLELRKRALKLKDVHMYDTYVPIVGGIKSNYPWDKGVGMVVDALRPLGAEYTKELERGLTVGRWCDRYPNQGKQSGAFSSGGYDGQPYILMNYQPSVLDHVFTLAHEAGHSMHTYYSAKNQPYQYYGYTIFVAEVASTFNEQFLLKHLLDKAQDKKQRAYLLNHAVDEIRGTIIRQTMFAEFEKISHALVESGEPLTVETLRGEYRKLLELYFGPKFKIDKELELECLRIPHFYRAFYVYKYATGLSAAIALSQRVQRGGAKELQDYLGFLKGGCSKWPLDLLRGAGVDMEQPGPVDTALKHFEKLVAELDELL